MSLIEISVHFSTAMLSLTVVFAFIRLVRGPSLPDRVIALDLMTTVGIGIIAVYAISTDKPVFLDVAVILALVSFVGTIAFAYYLQKVTDIADLKGD